MVIHISRCSHCHDQWRSESEKPYCSLCNTKEKREAMDKENIEHFKSKGLEYNPPKDYVKQL